MSSDLIKWREWGHEAFAESKAERKLILLDISAVWCHWCHVMDETSYSDPAVAGLINERYIPVRVDTDRMPDVNERYNMGGWPTTAVLIHTGEVLLGATYVPPEKLKETLVGLDQFYQENREELQLRVAELKKKKLEELKDAVEAAPGDVTPDAPPFVLGELEKNYDPVHGGFGTQPKFPAPDVIDLLLAAYHDTGKAAYLEMAEKTLDGMASYGMYDQAMGGFFRYSVTQDWTVPHYEKMLDSNSGLLINYINAYRLTGSARHLDTVRKTLDYIDRWLWAGAGYFCGSQDADEEYYKLPAEERMKRKPPAVDSTMFTNLNARMSSAYLAAWEVLGEDKYKDRALAALEFVLSRMKTGGGGLYHYFDGTPRRPGLLLDQSAAVKALLNAWQLTGQKRWLDEALSIIDYLDKTHWDFDYGGYYDLPEDRDAVASLAYRSKPLAENSEMALTLKTLYVITGDAKYREMARKCLGVQADVYRDAGYMAAPYALAVDFFLKEPVEVTVVGDTGSDGVAELMKAAFENYIPRRVLRVLDFARDLDEIKKRGSLASGQAAAYICRDMVCTARIDDPEALRGSLKEKTA